MHAKPKRVFKFLLIVVSTFSPLLDGFCYDITGINQRDTAQVIQLNQSAASILNAYPDSTNKLLLDALTISHEIGFGRGKAISCDHLGLVPFLKESYDSARYYWDMSLIEWEQARNNEQIAKTLEKLAKTLKLQSNFAQAISFYQRAIRLRFVIEDTLLIANNLQNIGSIYTEIGDPKKALQ